MLDNIKIVLVNTSHPGNIGSSARAMKTMGLSQLVLVDPVQPPDGKSVALAAGAVDILGAARTVATLDDAIADCGMVIGTSARSRTLQWPLLHPRETGRKLVSEACRYPVALVFGRERTGLTNEELQKCHFHVNIPANPEYSSLNLAMAVQTLSYEVRMAFLEQPDFEQQPESYPLQWELEQFYDHLEQTLVQTGFIIRQHPGMVIHKLRRLFNRARPEAQELNILRGVLSSIQRAIKSGTDEN